MTSSQICQAERVLRVDQLDVAEYDEFILGIIQAEISKCFKYFQPGILTKVDPELKAVLGLIIWKFSVYSNGATFSQQMLEIKFETLVNDGLLSKKQKIIYGLAMIGGQWFAERYFDIKQYFSRFGNMEKLWNTLDFGFMLHRFFSLLNFVVFLQNGRYKSLLERALRIYAVFSRKQSPREVYFYYMNHDILKNGFAEFLFCILPLVNIPRFRNLLLRVMWRAPNALQDGNTLLRRHCAICGELPTNVHQTRCAHVFCYICIKANAMADYSFMCPVCGEHVYDDIQPAKI